MPNLGVKADSSKTKPLGWCPKDNYEEGEMGENSQAEEEACAKILW
jgi:hypothetical protein